MKNPDDSILGNFVLSVVGIGLLLLFFGASGYGVYLAFSASIFLGLVVLLIEPAPLILGILGILGYTGVAQKIVEAASKFLN